MIHSLFLMPRRQDYDIFFNSDKNVEKSRPATHVSQNGSSRAGSSPDHPVDHLVSFFNLY